MGKAEERDGEKRGNHEGETKDVGVTAAEIDERNSREQGADKADAVEANAHVECLDAVQADLLKEVGGEADGVAAEILDDEEQNANLHAAAVGSLEAVRVRGSDLHLPLQHVRLDHHGQRLLGIDARVPLDELLQRLLGLVHLILSDEPPRRLWREGQPDQQNDGPRPLKSKGDAVRPLIGALDEAAGDARLDELAHDVAQVDVAGQETSQAQRQHLRCVGRGDDAVASPDDAADVHAGGQDADAAGEELHKGQHARHDEAGGQRPLAAEPLHGEGHEVRADYLPDQAAHAHCHLPPSGNLVTSMALAKVHAKVLLEGRQREEVTADLNVVRPHDDAEGDEHGPEDAFAVQLDAFPVADSMLRRRATAGHGGIDLGQLAAGLSIGKLMLHRVDAGLLVGSRACLFHGGCVSVSTTSCLLRVDEYKTGLGLAQK